MFRLRNILIFSIAIFTIIIYIYSAYLQYTSQYCIRLFSSDIEHWEGWCIIDLAINYYCVIIAA